MCVFFWKNEIWFLSKRGSSQLCWCSQCWMFKLDLSASVKRGVQTVLCWTPCELREMIYMLNYVDMKLICIMYYRLWICNIYVIWCHDNKRYYYTWEQYLYQFQWDKSPRWAVSFYLQVIEARDWKWVNFLTKHTAFWVIFLCLKIPGCISKEVHYSLFAIYISI